MKRIPAAHNSMLMRPPLPPALHPQQPTSWNSWKQNFALLKRTEPAIIAECAGALASKLSRDFFSMISREEILATSEREWKQRTLQRAIHRVPTGSCTFVFL